MAKLDKSFKQRIVGALVLVALAVIFLPMLLSRQDEARRVMVESPSIPPTPAVAQIEVDAVAVPEPQLLPDEPVPGEQPPVEPAAEAVPGEASAPSTPAPATPPPAASPAPVAPAATPAPSKATPPVASAPSRLDGNGLPVSWSIQLASLSSRASAEQLQVKLRSQGYNAYIRSVDSMNRVFVGPLIERAEAERLRDQLTRQQKLKGFVVRFQPERN